nr:translation initiation factor IF-2-like [Equus asinus]
MELASSWGSGDCSSCCAALRRTSGLLARILPKRSPAAHAARRRLGRLGGCPGVETKRVPFPRDGLGATGRCGRQPALFSYEGWGGGRGGGGEDGGGGGGRSNSSGVLGGGSWSPGGPSPASPTSRGESGSVAPAKAEPSLQRVRAGGGGEDRLLRRGPSPLTSPFPQNGAGLARTRRPRRAVAPALQAPGSSPPAAGPARPGAEGLGGGRNPAQRRRRSAPTQAGFSRGARHPEIEGRGSDAAGREGPAQEPLRPGGAPGRPAGAGLRARHARLGPCAAPAARAAPPFSPACSRRCRSALRIPSSRRLPAPHAAPASAHRPARPPPPPGRAAAPASAPSRHPQARPREAPGGRGGPSSPSSPKILAAPPPSLAPGAASSPRSPRWTWVACGPPPPPAWVQTPLVLAPLFCIPL